ncbi:YdcF family protein [Caryophanon latum]|uniref:DUF218 domain-containing protein n=1 Tax=Caryophanon latum TaxID=33977 RepID=A0A1C0YTY3_9BACL|nr:YdcF family protein [Caryophanon latum]OCS90625.1 hypothetical protein A6K76_10780 [Caryophanon latum]
MGLSLFLFILFLLFYIREPRRMITVFLFGLLIVETLLVFFAYQLDFFTYQVDDYYVVSEFYIYFIVAAIPLSLFALAMLMLLNSKDLMQREGKRVRNLFLAALACTLLFVIGYSVYFLWMTFQQSLTVANSILYIYIVTILGYFLFFFIVLAMYAVLYNMTPLVGRPQYIIVLGSGLIGDRVPPLLASRLDRAVKLFKRYDERPIFITSGGQGSDELVSEAFAMKKYVMDKHGLRDDQIVTEDKSTTTYENLTFSKRILHELLGNTLGKGAVVTNDFHVLRASIYAKQVGLHAKGVAATTAFYYVPNAFAREYIGLLHMYRKWHVLFLLLYSAAFLILYMLLK